MNSRNVLSTVIYKNSSLKEALKRIRTLGFESVELLADKTHLDPSVSSIDDARNIRNFSEELGLNLFSFHAPYSNVDLANKDRLERERSLGLILKALNYCVVLNCRLLVLHLNSSQSLRESSREEIMINSIESLKEVASTAEKYEIKVALETLMDHGKTGLARGFLILNMLLGR